VGKSTLIRLLLESVPLLQFSISHTTRPRRAAEQEGRDYFFVERDRFESMVAADEFVEWANVHGNLYGTARKHLEEVRNTGRDLILDVDVQGQQQVRKKLPEAITVFILPPSFGELKIRLLNRGSETDQAIQRRLKQAGEEIARWKDYDYLVVNDELHQAFEQLRAIVLATRARRGAIQNQAKEILETFGG
jgi:guanylate kinase